MSRMLDVLEIFLTFHGYTYLRLDGATPVQKRQVSILALFLLVILFLGFNGPLQQRLSHILLYFIYS